MPEGIPFVWLQPGRKLVRAVKNKPHRRPGGERSELGRRFGAIVEQ